MTELEQLQQERSNLLINADAGLITASSLSQRQLYQLISDTLENMEVDSDGRIRLNNRNIEAADRIIRLLKNGLSQTNFSNAMTEFLSKFDKSVELNQRYGRQFERGYTVNPLQIELIKRSKLLAVDLLANEGYKTRIDQTVRIPLFSAIQAGANLRETVRDIKKVVQGDKDADGRVLANVKTYANTTFATADRSLANSVAQEVGAQWYRYVGGEIDTTRSFCDERNGKYYHKEEIRLWAEKEWDGQILGTNSDNIFVLAGGWNCRHSIMAVPIFSVPNDVVERAISKGYFKR